MPDQQWEQFFGKLRRQPVPEPATYLGQLYRGNSFYEIKYEIKVEPTLNTTEAAPLVVPGPAPKVAQNPEPAKPMAAEAVASPAPAATNAIKIPRPEASTENYQASRYDFSFNVSANFMDQVRAVCEQCCPPDIIEHSLVKTQHKTHDGKLDIMFIGEPGAEPIMELWEKMIVAMTQLKPFQWKLNLLGQCSGECREFVLADMARHQPKLVICFGAQATNLLLDRKLKLSQEHGKNFLCQLSPEAFSQDKALEFKLIPVFHPYFLKINPSMKRTAWDDLQKSLNFLS